MNKTTEALKLAEEAANRVIEALEYLKTIGIHPDSLAPAIRAEKKALAAIREALADHSGDANEMVADTNPLSVFAKECVLGAYTYDELPDAARLALKRAKKAEPVKREWVDLTDDELKAALEVHQVGLSVRIGRIAIAAFKEKNK